jgi:hypothetical protein
VIAGTEADSGMGGMGLMGGRADGGLDDLLEALQILFEHPLRILQQARQELAHGAAGWVVPLHHDVHLGVAVLQIGEGHRAGRLERALGRVPADGPAGLILGQAGVELYGDAHATLELPV